MAGFVRMPILVTKIPSKSYIPTWLTRSSGLLLLDPPTDIFPSKAQMNCSSQKNTWKHIPFQGGCEDIFEPTKFSTFTSSSQQPNHINSILFNFLRYYQHRPQVLDLEHPDLLLLLHYPIRWVSSNWMLYTMLVNRYYKLYEYSIKQNNAERRLETNLIDLQRWGRRTKQSISKLKLITAFIHLNLPSSHDRAQVTSHDEGSKGELYNLCTTLLGDYDHIIEEIKDYRNGIDFLISISTTMFQLRKAEESVREAVNIRRLTYVTLFSARCGLVAAIFGMSANFMPGQPDFWVFMVIALIATSFVALLALMPGSVMRRVYWYWANTIVSRKVFEAV